MPHHRITHPTKEQVRAYMAEREAARRPPPAPEEIRQKLGWRLDTPERERLQAQFCLIPSSYTQMAAQIALVWMCVPLRCLRAPEGARAH
jgi:hypothetical protein